MKRESCYVKAGEIKIPLMFVNHPPKEEKLNRYRKDFIRNKVEFCTRKPIVVDANKQIIDGYISYLIFKEFYELLDLNFENQILLVYKQIEDYRHEPTTYVYGRHPGKNKEYVWRMQKTADYIPENGETVLVSTGNGIVPIIVTKTLVSDSCPYEGKVKLVQSYENKKSDESNKDDSHSNWDEFRNSGLLWIVNTVLVIFGWGICFKYINNEISAVYPCKTKHKFTKEENERGRKKFLEYIGKENGKNI